MKSNKILMLGFFLMVSFSTIYAQVNTANQLIEESRKNYFDAKNIYIEFLFKGKSSNLNGKLYIKNEKYSLILDNSHQIYDGKNLYTILDEEKEITISLPKKESLYSLARVFNLLKKGYAPKIIKKAGDITYIKLTPIDLLDKNSVEIAVNNKTKEIKQIKEFKNKIITSDILITKYKSNIALAPSTFIFEKQKYKTYYITNLSK